MIKKFIALLLTFVFCLTFTACNTTSQSYNEKTTTEETTTEETTLETTEASTTEASTKKMVSLLSCCPTYEEFIETLNSNDLVNEIHISRKDHLLDDGDLTATLSVKYLVGTYNIAIIYEKSTRKIYNILVQISSNDSGDQWMEMVGLQSVNLLYEYLKSVPGYIDADTLAEKLVENPKREIKDSYFYFSGDYSSGGIDYSVLMVSPEDNGYHSFRKVEYRASIDKDKMIEEPQN